MPIVELLCRIARLWCGCLILYAILNLIDVLKAAYYKTNRFEWLINH